MCFNLPRSYRERISYQGALALKWSPNQKRFDQGRRILAAMRGSMVLPRGCFGAYDGDPEGVLGSPQPISRLGARKSWYQLDGMTVPHRRN